MLRLLDKPRDGRVRPSVRRQAIMRLLPIAVFVTACCACGGSAPMVAPTSPPATTPNVPFVTRAAEWTVMIQTTAVTGPAFCIFTPSVGSVFQGEYEVAWDADTVSFLPPDPIDWDSFTGHLTGSDFAATNPPIGSGGGMCTHYLQASDLVGSFAADQQTFKAIAHWYFTLDSGEVKTVTFLWSGTRR